MDIRPPTIAEPPVAQAQPTEPPAGGNRQAELALIVFFLALVATVPIFQAGLELARDGRVEALEIFHRKPTSVNLRAYEHHLEDGSVVARTLRPWFQFAQFAWLRDGGKKALVGRDGWLFYKPGFDDALARGREALSGTNDPVAAIVAFRDALAARGIHLLVLPAPNKSSIYPDKVTSRFAAGRTVLSPTTRQTLARLRAAGVEYVDLFAAFAQARTNSASRGAPALYLAQDSHWSPAGVAIAARIVARRLVELGWVRKGAMEYQERAAPVKHLGDILRMLRSPGLERRTVPERVPCVQVVHGTPAQPYQDNPNSSILILGDSFLRVYEQDEPGSSGLIAHLAKELKQALASLVSDGGASTIVRQELYGRPALLKHKRVVIWEFVERDIRLGLEGWQRVPVPPAATGSRD